MTSHRARLGTLLVAVAMVATGCDLDLGEEEPTVTTRVDAGIDFLVCQIADERGLDDHSYNQAIQRGVQRAANYLGVDTLAREAVTEQDLPSEFDSLAQRGCDLIVFPEAVGDYFAHVEARPELDFAVVDTDGFETAYTDDGPPNVVQVEFESGQAGFLAGYAAAAASRSGALGIVRGRDSEALKTAAEGFISGVRRFNEGGSDVRVGLTPVTPTPEDAALAHIRDGADIIFVATTKSSETLDPARVPDSAALIWYEENGCRALPERCERFFTSVVNNVDTAVFDLIKETIADGFESGWYRGTLENGGVGLAPFNSFGSRVSQQTRQELVELRDSIIAGDLEV